MTKTTASDTVLDEVAQRAFKFLGAVSSRMEIRAQLAQRGYTEDDHQRGWGLVLEISGYRGPATPTVAKPDAVAAIAELDAWDEPNFRIARAALATMPEQLAFLFDRLEAQTNAAAVGSVTTFLDRLDALEAGTGRDGTQAEDQAALAKLTARGITTAERARLRKLIEQATLSPDVVVTPASVGAAAAELKDKQRARKQELYTWFAEWSEVARVVVKRRDYLIQLGLANRKKKAKPTETSGTSQS